MMPYALRPRPLLRTRLAIAGAVLLLATPIMTPSFVAHAAEASAADTKPADAKPTEAAPAGAKTATIDQVYAAARSGDLPGALAMMAPVLKAHPDSAKAHFVEAELLARTYRIAEARDELAKAESLAPSLPGIKPSAVTALRAQLNGGSAQGAMRSATPMVAPARSHVPWGAIIIIGLAILGFVALTRRRTAPPAYPPYPQAYGPGAGGAPGGMMGGGAPGYGPGYGGMGGGMGGGGILGGLASGAAMGAGFAAGEEIVGHMFGGGHGERPIDGGAQGGWDQGGNPNADMGGDDFGISDAGSWDDGGGAGGGDGGW